MENDLQKMETRFFSSLGNGKEATKAMYALFKSVVNSRDTTCIARQIVRAEKEKGDMQAANTLRFVTGQVFPGAKYGKDKNGIPTIKIKDCQPDMAALNRLHIAGEKKLSIRHTAFRKAVKAPADQPKETKEQRLARVKAYVQKQVSDDMTLDMIIAAVESLRNA